MENWKGFIFLIALFVILINGNGLNPNVLDQQPHLRDSLPKALDQQPNALDPLPNDQEPQPNPLGSRIRAVRSHPSGWKTKRHAPNPVLPLCVDSWSQSFCQTQLRVRGDNYCYEDFIFSLYQCCESCAAALGRRAAPDDDPTVLAMRAVTCQDKRQVDGSTSKDWCKSVVDNQRMDLACWIPSIQSRCLDSCGLCKIWQTVAYQKLPQGKAGTFRSCKIVKYEGVQFARDFVAKFSVGSLEGCLEECVNKQPECKSVSYEALLQICTYHSNAVSKLDRSNSQRETSSTYVTIDCENRMDTLFDELMKRSTTPAAMQEATMAPEFTFYTKTKTKTVVITTDATSFFDALVIGLGTESYLVMNCQIVFIVHGLMGHGKEKWIADVRKKILDVTLPGEDTLVVEVSWPNGAMTNKNVKDPLAILENYPEGAANTKTVAKLMAAFEIAVFSYAGGHFFGIQPYIHCIGYSMGAHICGQASRAATTHFNRITALDPAVQIFRLRTDLSLDKTSADCVDVIHSGIPEPPTHGFGMEQAIGHADYYLNGGSNQPNCAKPGKKPMMVILCNHFRSVQRFNDSITQSNVCPAFGPCGPGKGRLESQCTDNNGHVMGYFSACKTRRGTYEGEYFVKC